MTQSTPTSERTHPVHRFAGAVLDAFARLGDPVTWSMTGDELAETITDLGRGLARLTGLQHQVVAQADVVDLAAERAAVNTAALVRDLTLVTGPAASRMVKTARALEKHPTTQRALASGAVVLEQATEILRAVDALPPEVDPVDRDKAEQHLVNLAEQHDARELRRLGQHLLEVVDPDGADAQLAATLEAQERDAARKTFLTVRDCGDGTHEGRFKIPTLHAAMLTRQLEALMNPSRPDPISSDGKTRPEVRGEAFTQWISRYPTDRLPTSGGVAATVVVTIPLDTLLHGLQAAALDTGDLISPTLARRLACEAGIIPAVLGSNGEVLDLGRKTRFHTPKQRLAMNLQQHGTCAVERCTVPATWSDAHHLTPWSQGGHTSVHDGVLTCTRHHTQVHDPRYTVERIRPGKIRLVRRQ